MANIVNYFAGDRVKVSEECPWAKSATGVIQKNPNPGNYNKDWKGCPRTEFNPAGPLYFYWVEFDSPQKSARNNDLSDSGEIEAKFLTKIEEDPVSKPAPHQDEKPAEPAGPSLDDPAPGKHGKHHSAKILPHPGLDKVIEAGVIDLAICLAIAIAFMLAARFAGKVSLVGATPSEYIPLVAAVLLVVWFYQVFFLSLFGQTPGQMTAKIVVIDRSNKRPSFFTAGTRALVYILCLLPAGMGFLPTLLGESIPDRAAGTKLGYQILE